MGESVATVDDAAAELEQIRAQLAPGASKPELEWFVRVARHLELDPFRGQIVLIPRKQGDRQVYRPQITVDGRRAMATRSGKLAGIEGPWWSGPRNEAGELVWLELWPSDTPPYAARVLVHRHGWIVPANGTAKWSEFAQWNMDGTLRATWASMPAHMLAKVAESIALRRAFPEIIGAAIGTADDEADAIVPGAMTSG